MNQIYADREARQWNEAFPVGNGFLGGMIFGGTGMERVQVNEDSLWSGGFMERLNPDAREHLPQIRTLLKEERLEEAQRLTAQSMYGTYYHMRHYQTLGDVWIDFFREQGSRTVGRDVYEIPQLIYTKPVFRDYQRRLDVEEALGKISYSLEEKSCRREFFASHPDMVLVYRMEADGGTVDFDVSLTRKDNRLGRGSSFCDGTEVLDGGIIRLYGQQGGADGIGFEFLALVRSTGGKQITRGSHIIVEGAENAAIYLTARTTFRSENPLEWCLETLHKAAARSYAELKSRHLEDYRRLYRRSTLTLPAEDRLDALTTRERLERLRTGETDTGLVNLYYNYAKYLFISAGREHSLPLNLQGIWNEDFEPMWGSKYTININTEMNYWPAEKWGLSELHLPLLEHLERMHPHGQRTAREMYGARGFCCHHNTDLWGDCAPQDGNIASTVWPMGGAWLCLHLAEHFRYTRDEAVMKRFYPLLRNSVLFFLDYLFRDERGYWVTGPSSSPENFYLNERNECGCLCLGPTMDMEILKDLFRSYLQITEELGADRGLTAEVQEKLAGLPPLQIGKHGQIMEWQKDYEELEIGHRHISQLYALYPAGHIRPDQTPELAAAARNTLERRLSHGGGHTGWSRAWITLFYARLGDRRAAWENLQELLKSSTLDNLLDNHPPFQIDGNFGGAAGLLEMLVQDFETELFLLPALPEALAAGQAAGIHTKCGGILDFSWQNGQLTELKLTASRNVTVSIIYSLNTENRSLGITLKQGEIFRTQED